MVPAGHGGRHERIDPLAVAVVREVLMGTSSHLDSLFALQGIGSYAITAGGTDAQHDAGCRASRPARRSPALALTEPDAGSDLKGVTTELVADGDGSCWAARRRFISNGGAAAFYSVLARDGDGTDGARPRRAPGL